jgi:hypothetical protein
MKTRKAILLLLALSASFASAATTLYTVTTGSTATSAGVANKDGLQFQSSSVAAFTSAGPAVVSFGYFSITDLEIGAATSMSTLTSAWKQWNGATTTFAAPGPSQFRGVFSSAATARDLSLPANSDFASKNMYVLIGNGTTYANSDQALVLKTSFIFDPLETGPTAFSKTITTLNSSALFGSQVLDVRTTATDASATPGWRTAAFVPEPSAALLGAIGALGLLRRRRI